MIHESLPKSMVIPRYADVGIIQPDHTKVDIDKTISLLNERCTHSAIEEWANIPKQYDLVIADIPPLIFAASQKANVPVLGISNFDWIWIYQHFPRLEKWSKTMQQWQEGHQAIQLLPGAPLHCSIQAHAHWIDRENKEPLITFPSRSILVGLGGPRREDILKLPFIKNIYWILPFAIPTVARKDIKYAHSIPFPSLVNAVDIIFSKAGYGILAESQVTGTPQIWMKRLSFPEVSILESFARSKGDIIIESQWGTKRWQQELRGAIFSMKGTQRSPQKNENHRPAQWIMQTYS
ncbi:MAG: hypothetical protein CL916_08630 [Deltaproteobacteria bacterium]|nr:hypothetical protein [Deltaproteobacteria bacterium]